MKVILRKATADDSRDVWLWRNDEEARRNSRTTDFITWERHDAWYQAMLKNRDSQILIALDAGVGNGMVRFDQIEPISLAQVSPWRRWRKAAELVALSCVWDVIGSCENIQRQPFSRKFESKISPRNASLKQIASIAIRLAGKQNFMCM